MAKKVYSKAEKRSWLNGLRLGELRAGKKAAPKKNGLGYSNENSSFDVDEFYQKALARTAARTTKTASKPAKKRHAKKSTYKQVKKPLTKSEKEAFDSSQAYHRSMWQTNARFHDLEYHSFVEKTQARLGRVLTRSEKAKLRKEIYKPHKPGIDWSEYFDFTPSGRIKGSYVDGKFEPD